MVELQNKPYDREMRYTLVDSRTGAVSHIVCGPENRCVSEDGIVTFQSKMISWVDEDGDELDPVLMSLDKPLKPKLKQHYVLTITEDGRAQLVADYVYRRAGRGGNGYLNIQGGRTVVVLTCLATDQVIIIGNKGTTLRTYVGQIRKTNRGSEGVKIIDLKEGETVASVDLTE